MAARTEVGREIQKNAPGNPKPAGLKPDGVDVLVSRFLTELTDIATEMQPRDDSAGAASIQQMPPPAKRNGAFDSGSKLDSAGGEGKAEKPLSQLEHLRSAGSPAAEKKNSGPVLPFAPAAEKVQTTPVAASPPAAKPARAGASPGAGEYGRKNLDALRATVISQGGDRRRKKTFLVLPAAMLAIILGALYFFQTDKKTPASEAYTQDPAVTVIQPGAVIVGAVPRKEQGEPSAVSPKTEIRSSRPDSAAIQEQAAAKSALNPAAPPNAKSNISRPDPSPVMQIERPAEPTKMISEALPRKIQEEPRPQNDPAAVVLPPVTSSPEGAATGTGSPPAGGRELQNAGQQADSAAVEFARETAPREPAQNADAKNAAAKPESPRAPIVPPVPSQVLVKVLPEYPTIARTQKVDGTVELDAYISEKGDVVRADVVTGPTLFRAAAEDALLKWKFKPASVNGVPVPSRSRVFIVFKWKSL